MRSSARSIVAPAALALALAACSGSDADRGSTSGRSGEGARTARGGSSEHAVAEGAGGAGASGEGAGAGHEEPVASPRVVLEPPGREPATVSVEVARTPAETQRGLMYRRHMEPDAGMLFLFSRPRHMTFWMHNTLIPLDMIFITSDMRVLGVVENATPETDDSREVEGISQFVLEVNAGWAREHGVAAGTSVRFEGIPDVPAAGAAVEDEEDEEWE